MSDSATRLHLRRQLEAHLIGLGYSFERLKGTATPVPEIVRISPVRGRIAYGEVVAHGDLQLRRCHARLLSFSQRRTRHRSTILFFIGVAESDAAALRALLEELEICSGTRGGHVHVVPIAAAPERRRTATARRVKQNDQERASS